MKRILMASVLATLGACGSSEVKEDMVLNKIDAELERREANRAAMAAATPANRALIVGRWGLRPAVRTNIENMVTTAHIGSIVKTTRSARETLPADGRSKERA